MSNQDRQNDDGMGGTNYYSRDQQIGSPSSSNRPVHEDEGNNRTAVRGYNTQGNIHSQYRGGGRRDDYDESNRNFSWGRSCASDRGYWDHEFGGGGGGRRRARSKSWSKDHSGNRDPSARRREPSNSRGRGDGRFRDSVSASRGRRQHSSSYVDDQDDRNQWRCTNCNMWNTGDAIECESCQAYTQGKQQKAKRRRSNSRSRDRARSRGKSMSASPGRRSRRSQSFQDRSQQQESEWPPCFEKDGSAFVLDSRSGMFYESLSDFFYDPKSKLYYGNKKGSYFKYDDSLTQPFVEFHKVVENPGKGVDPTAVSLDPIADTTIEVKKTSMISINIKSKKVKKRMKTSEPKVASQPVVMKHQKQQVANIEKWAGRQAEIKAELPTGSASPVDSASTATSNPENIVRTAKGEPICTICKRKFPTVEKLQLHERMSELHKQNLAKQATTTAAVLKRKPSPPSTEYQDRAKKRRELHGPEAAIPPPNVASFPIPSHDPEPQRPEDNLGSSNIGNQMLQKLGWKEGSTLGKKSNDGSEAEAGDSETARAKTEDSRIQHLRQDWDRIESMASSRKRST